MLDIFPNAVLADDLVKRTSELQDNPDEPLEILKHFMNTDIYVGLLTFHQIALELSISGKQNTSKLQFIYKRLIILNVELIVHPVRSDSHIFFSVRFKGHLLNSTVFRPCFEQNLSQ